MFEYWSIEARRIIKKEDYFTHVEKESVLQKIWRFLLDGLVRL